MQNLGSPKCSMVVVAQEELNDDGVFVDACRGLNLLMLRLIRPNSQLLTSRIQIH